MKKKVNSILLSVGPNDIGRRLDKILRKVLPGLHLSTIYGDLRKGRIRVNGKKRKGAYRVKEGDNLFIPEEYKLRTSPTNYAQEEFTRENHAVKDLSFIILHEDSNFLVCNKEAGSLTHGGNDLTKAVIAYLSKTQTNESSLAFTPGPLHRLDRNTSGILYFSKSIYGARIFTSLQKSHCLKKKYLAVIEGILSKPGVWENVLVRDKKAKVTRVRPWAEGRPSRCSFRPIAYSKDKTLVSLELRSGFTHQIRVQSGYNGHPLYGDRKYGGTKRQHSSYLLHALTLSDDCTTLGEESIPQVIAPLPVSFSSFILKEFSLSPEKATDTSATFKINKF